jgi:hypothetical protein
MQARPPWTLDVASLTLEHIALWNSMPGVVPANLRTFSPAAQRFNDDRAEQTLRGLIRSTSRSEGMRMMRGVLADLAESLGEGLASAGRTILELMIHTGEQFVARARDFDPSLDHGQITQALRNLWIMNSIQVLLGGTPSVTPSAFGYSLLYPYTDNLLDDPALTRIEKRAFARRLRDRLSGASDVEPHSATESRIWSLISAIEAEWPRILYPSVYASLLAIHAAQEEGSEHCSSSLPDRELTRLTFAKGGTSVLAHGYLLLGGLSCTATRWMFGYGTFLQLVDDLEDFEEDRARDMATLFTTSRRETRERLIHRLFSYGDEVMCTFPVPASDRERALHQLIRSGYRFLVIQSVAGHPATTGRSFARRLEVHSPLRFSSIRSLRRRGSDLPGWRTLSLLLSGMPRPGTSVRNSSRRKPTEAGCV